MGSTVATPDVHLIDASQEPSFLEPSNPRWYLAYGSNLNSSVFLARRGISPLLQKVVLVKGLELTFDNHAIPYAEPRFANSRITSPPLLKDEPDLKKPWTGRGCLLGVAYLVTPADFSKIMIAEGGGTVYQPVMVDSHVVGENDEMANEVVQAYTLITNRVRMAAGQPSLRYVTLVRKGAREHNMPAMYIDFLDNLPYYKPGRRQRIGRLVFFAVWLPLLLPMRILPRLVADKDGKPPAFLTAYSQFLVDNMWRTHDHFFKYVFGSGENLP